MYIHIIDTGINIYIECYSAFTMDVICRSRSMLLGVHDGGYYAARYSRYATFSIFCYFRSQLCMDSLADLFMKLTHQLQTKSESFFDKKLLEAVKHIVALKTGTIEPDVFVK